MNYLVKIISSSLLAGCSSTGLLNEPPRVSSAATAVDVRIQNVIAGEKVTFFIDDVEIFRFVEPSYFDFVIDSAGYRFGYEKGGAKCYAQVMLSSGNTYVFNLEPDCVIEMQ